MKNFVLGRWLVLLLSFTTTVSMAQNGVNVYIRSVADYSNIAEYDNAATQVPRQKPIIPDSDPGKYLWHLQNDSIDLERICCCGEIFRSNNS